MKLYVQGWSALAHYRSPEARICVERTGQRQCKLLDATASIVDIREMHTYRLGIEDISKEHPLEVLVPDRAKRGNSRLVKPRVWSTPIQGNAFRQVDKEQYVSSPEFTFLQLANELSLPELVALGMELCGTYRRNVAVGQIDSDETDYVTEYHAPILTTPRRIEGFLRAMPKAPGIRAAKEALRFIVPRSASPLETAVYLLFCLPRRMGGYGLPKPELNPRITFSKSGRRYTLRQSAKPDLFWRPSRLDVECNGVENHGENQRPADSMRRKALERMKVEVIELTKEEVYDAGIFHAIVLRIARKIGKKIRPEHEGDFIEKRAVLRSLVLFDDRGNTWTDPEDLMRSRKSPADIEEQEWTVDAQGIDVLAESGEWDILPEADVDRKQDEWADVAGEVDLDFVDQIDPEVFDDSGVFVYGGTRVA